MLKVMLAESTDRELEQQLKAAGAEVEMIGASQLLALAAPAAVQPDVLVIDVRNSNGLPSAIGAVHRAHPATPLVLVAPTLDQAFLLEALRTGANEVLSAPVTAADVERALARVAGLRPHAATGEVFAFVGAKGGVGTTTTAVNVAVALGDIGKPARTLLIDMHQASGDSALFFGASPRFSFVDAIENVQRLDTTFLKSTVEQVTTHVDLLAAPAESYAGVLQAAAVRSVIDVAARAYRYTVLDLPRSNAVILDALDAVAAIVVVANQELPTVRSAARLVDRLRRRYGRDKVMLVLSRSDRRSEISDDAIEKTTGARIMHQIPSAYREAVHALNMGRPLALSSRGSLVEAFRDLAIHLSRADRSEVNPRGFIERLTHAVTL